MTEPTDPIESADSAEPVDPFERLLLAAAPIAPRPAFAGELRRRIETALDPTDQTDPDAAQTMPGAAGRAARISTATKQEHAMTDTDPPTDEQSPTDQSLAAPSPLVPYLAVADVAAAIDWYRDALGAIETLRYVGDDGRVGHAELSIGTARVMLSDEHPEIGVVGPATLGGTTFALHLEVVDVDYTHRVAVSAGATSLREPADQGYGDRNATIIDPFGHRWMLAQPIDASRTQTAVEDSGVGGNNEDWTVTGRTPVEPGYITFPTADLAKARAFYGELFAWKIEDGNEPGGGHIANTRFPMGIRATADAAGSDRGTTVYFRVDDIESYATKVEELGGRVLSRNDYDSGGNAECVDDQGEQFDLFRPNPGY